MDVNFQYGPEDAIQSNVPFSPYALEVSVGESSVWRYHLRSDKPTWIGRRPSASYDDFEYIQVPGSNRRYHCRFDWDAQKARFGLTKALSVGVRVNGDLTASDYYLLSENDVITVPIKVGGPELRVRLVRIAEANREDAKQGN